MKCELIFSCQLGTCILFHVFYWHICRYPSFRLQITHCALFILLISGPFYTKFAVSGIICWKPSGPARGTNFLNWVILISFSESAVFNALAWCLWDWIACNFMFITWVHRELLTSGWYELNSFIKIQVVQKHYASSNEVILEDLSLPGLAEFKGRWHGSLDASGGGNGDTMVFIFQSLLSY